MSARFALTTLVLLLTSASAGSVSAQEIGTTPFRRGDVNGDLVRDISDPVFVIGYLLAGGAAPGCLDAADANDDGVVNLADAVHLLSFLFVPAITTLPAPFPGAGVDPNLDSMVCGCVTQAEIQALVQSVPPSMACVPSFSVNLGLAVANICTGSPPICAGSTGCSANITLQTIGYNPSNQTLTATGTIHVPSVPVSAGFLGSCNGTFNANFSVLITTTSVPVMPMARRITSYDVMATVTNPTIGGCGLLGSALNLAAGLFADQLEQEIEDAIEPELNASLVNLVVCN